MHLGAALMKNFKKLKPQKNIIFHFFNFFYLKNCRFLRGKAIIPSHRVPWIFGNFFLCFKNIKNEVEQFYFDCSSIHVNSNK